MTARLSAHLALFAALAIYALPVLADGLATAAIDGRITDVARTRCRASRSP